MIFKMPFSIKSLFSFRKKAKERELFERSIQVTIKYLQEEIALYVDAIDYAEKTHGKNEHAYKMVTSLHFILLSFCDIMIVIKYLSMNSLDEHEKNYFARSFALLCYEFLMDSGVIFSKELQPQVDKLNNKVVSNHFVIVWSMYKSLNKNVKFLKTIRHEIIGHKKRNIVEQHIQISSLDVKQIEGLSMQFFLFIYHMLKFKKAFQAEMLAYISSPKTP